MTTSPEGREDQDIQRLFSVFRAQVFRASKSFHSRLQAQLDEVDRNGTTGHVSVFGLMLSSLVQATNMVTGLVEPRPSERQDTDRRR